MGEASRTWISYYRTKALCAPDATCFLIYHLFYIYFLLKILASDSSYIALIFRAISASMFLLNS